MATDVFIKMILRQSYDGTYYYLDCYVDDGQVVLDKENKAIYNGDSGYKDGTKFFYPLTGEGYDKYLGATTDMQPQTTVDTKNDWYPVGANGNFTLKGEAQFIYRNADNLYFTFSGDDDVYLFINNKLALDIGGSTAGKAGHANPEELAGFLRFCGCRAIILDEAEAAPPAGWTRARTHSIFGLTPGRQLPQPHADVTLWASLRLEREPSAYPVAEELFPDRPARRDDLYSELCSKRSRGKARVWALMQGEEIACTVGAYAIANGQAYMACGQTAEELRGKGIGGRLIVQLANELSAEGLQPVFLCSPERVHFYTRLGFEKLGEYARYEQTEN